MSEQFDDFYYSTDGGMSETEYVFLEGNRLLQRWTQHKSKHFVIGETGFGTGLNFLTTWFHYRQRLKNTEKLPRLHFISFEKYPIGQTDLQKVLDQWPQLAKLSKQLLKQYPKPLAGCHRMSFDDGQVTLDLWLGDIQQTLTQLMTKQRGYVDAWYLDGFAPTKNTSMWHPQVIKGLVELSTQQATIATFTCARTVKDTLVAAGFTLNKRKGFGIKREMLTGCLERKPLLPKSIPFYYRHDNQADKSVAIIGGGIASAQMAYALAKRGYNITLFCKDAQLAQGASQNRQGALYPLLHAQYSPLSEFYSLAYIYALRQYHQLLEQGYDFPHDFCSVILQTFNEKTETRHNALTESKLWPPHLYRPMTAEQCSKLAGISLPFKGLHFAQGGWINPAGLINALLNAASELSSVQVRLNQPVQSLEPNANKGWIIGQEHFANVVVCCGHLSKTFSQTQDLPLSPIRGQISHLDESDNTKALGCVLCYNGYMTPTSNGQHSIGASFIKGDDNTEVRQIEHQRNLERMQKGLGNPVWLENVAPPKEGRAAIRCASIDHLPLAGSVPDFSAYRQTYQDLYKGLKPERYDTPPDYENLYILTGLGARGLCSAPLAAEIIAAQMSNEPYPASRRVLDALNPGRSYIKQLKGQF